MRKWLVAILLMMWGHGVALGGEPYDYPFADPLLATIAGSPADEALKGVIVKEKVYDLRIASDRELPPTMHHLRSYRFSLAWQRGPAPLIFIVPGTGASFSSGRVKLLQKVYHDAGFHVISLNSTFTRRFAATGSRSGIVGITATDAEDLYRLMEMAVNRVSPKVTITEFHLTGYSLGGLTAAFLSRLDEERKAFAFKRVLLVNPPVDLYSATRLFDDYVARNLGENEDAFFDGIFRKASKYFEYKGDVYIDEEFLYDINRIAPLSRGELEGLIGAAFRISLATVLFSVDMLTDGGHVKPRGKTIYVGTSTTEYFKASLGWTFEDYLDRVLLPHWRKRTPSGTRAALIRELGLTALADYLRGAENVGVVHNADDIIISEQDLAFLHETFGGRARIWPSGGHLGNILYGPNVAHMVRFFKDESER